MKLMIPLLMLVCTTFHHIGEMSARSFTQHATNVRVLMFSGLVELLEGSAFDDLADNFSGKGFVFGS